MRTPGAIEILEGLFEHDPPGSDLMLDLKEQLVNDLLLAGVVEGLSLGVDKIFLGLVDLVKLVLNFLTELGIVN